MKRRNLPVNTTPTLREGSTIVRMVVRNGVKTSLPPSAEELARAKAAYNQRLAAPTKPTSGKITDCER